MKTRSGFVSNSSSSSFLLGISMPMDAQSDQVVRLTSADEATEALGKLLVNAGYYYAEEDGPLEEYVTKGYSNDVEKIKSAFNEGFNQIMYLSIEWGGEESAVEGIQKIVKAKIITSWC